MFIRFVRPNALEGMAARQGFFCAAYELRYANHLDPFATDQLESLLSWFRTNLAVPKSFSRSNSKGGDPYQSKGLSWFKPEANLAIAKSYELIALLESNGYPVETIKSNRVGFVVFEDDWQVVAEPFADTPV